MDEAPNQLAEKLKSANNILVTVSRNPSVDQLAACLGLTLLLDKMGKHAVSVFSGEVPSTLEFLEPDKTIEKNTDSLRDFIISLDKEKADKLRYKVEDNVVRIYITPYKTSIGPQDFEFSQGDFNVELIVALGVSEQQDLDEAITAHGRILHDATLTSITTQNGGDFGAINWFEPRASSLSELVTELVQLIGPDLIDGQIATALLTGIVAETDRFSNEKTNPQALGMSSILMAAGANQQLVASKLQAYAQPDTTTLDVRNQPAGPADSAPPAADDGMIAIDHPSEIPAAGQPPSEGSIGTLPPLPDFQTSDFELPTPDFDNLPSERAQTPSSGQPSDPNNNLSAGSKLVTQPPSMGGMLTANTQQEQLDPATDPLGVSSIEPPQLLNRSANSWLASAPAASPPFTPTPPATPSPTIFSPSPPPSNPDPVASPWTPPAGQPGAPATGDRSLADLEEAVKSPHTDTESAATESTAASDHLNTARDEVSQALNGAVGGGDQPQEPIAALGAQPMGGELHPDDSSNSEADTSDEASTPPTPAEPYLGPSLEDILSHNQADAPAPAAPSDDTATDATDSGATPPADDIPPAVIDSNAPPPVPPPIPFQFGNPPAEQ